MALILLREDNILQGKSPVYSQGRVVPGYCAFLRWLIESIALILENGLLAKYGKAVGKTARHKELAVIL